MALLKPNLGCNTAKYWRMTQELGYMGNFSAFKRLHFSENGNVVYGFLIGTPVTLRHAGM